MTEKLSGGEIEDLENATVNSLGILAHMGIQLITDEGEDVTELFKKTVDFERLKEL